MGLFIGASILYLYDVSTYFILQIITKFKRRFGATDLWTIKEVKIEPYENENSKILIKIQQELAKLTEMLAKHDNKINTIEIKTTMDHNEEIRFH